MGRRFGRFDGKLQIIALALLLAAACRPARSAPAAASPEPDPPLLRVLITADFGDSTFQQWWVSRAMAAAVARRPFDLALAIGDNVYQCGPDTTLPGAGQCAFQPDGSAVESGYQPPADPLFRRAHERAMSRLQLAGGQPLPVYLALGNHDVNAGGDCGVPGQPAETVSRTRACLEVAHRSPQWIMPGRHYLLDRGPVRFIVVDSNLLEADYGGFTLDGEVEFVRQAVRGCAGRRCFIVAHHPPAAARAGWRAPATPEFLARVARIEQAAGPIAGWFSGHIHDLQHLRAPAGYDVFISGNSARGRGEAHQQVWGVPGTHAVWGSVSWGFAVLEVWPDHWSVRYEDSWGKPLHCCSAAAGPCEPVTCAPR